MSGIRTALLRATTTRVVRYNMGGRRDKSSETSTVIYSLTVNE